MNKQKALLGLFGILTIMASLFLQAMPAHKALATGISGRSLTLEAGPGPNFDGGSLPGGLVNHYFQFTLPTAGVVGSITFQYCTTAADVGAQTCVTPTGLLTSTVTGVDESGSQVTGWSLGTGQPNGTVLVTKSATSITANSVIDMLVQGVTNPIDATNYPNGMTFFVRINSYASTDGTGSAIDSGTVAAATNNAVDLSGNMPESLVFCTATTIGLTSGVPDCNNVTTGTINFNSLFSPTSTSVATSQMAASTNALTGYAITVNGTTLESGGNPIKAINSTNDPAYDATAASPWSEPSRYGISQFGLNVVQNDATAGYTNAPVISGLYLQADSANVSPASGTGNFNGRANPDNGYATNGYFKFNSGDVVADSNYPTTGAIATDAQIYTVSYIVNVPGSQAAGTYQTTLTYICTPTY